MCCDSSTFCPTCCNNYQFSGATPKYRRLSIGLWAKPASTTVYGARACRDVGTSGHLSTPCGCESACAANTKGVSWASLSEWREELPNGVDERGSEVNVPTGNRHSR